MTVETADKIGRWIAAPLKALRLWARRLYVHRIMRKAREAGLVDPKFIGESLERRLERHIFGSNQAY